MAMHLILNTVIVYWEKKVCKEVLDAHNHCVECLGMLMSDPFPPCALILLAAMQDPNVIGLGSMPLIESSVTLFIVSLLVVSSDEAL